MTITAQFLLFSAAGVFAAIGHYGTLIALSELAEMGPVPASLAGFVVGGVISYLLNYRFTFRSSKQHSEALAKFFVVAAVGFVLNGAIMAGLTGPARLHYLPAQLLTTGVVLLWTFFCNRFWTFREGKVR
ncbi:MAG TPA: GtrA family protein [Alphaproteobacteria bacterium]|nr:GtrA family protein [Alphaproteobacteria bacterium]